VPESVLVHLLLSLFAQIQSLCHQVARLLLVTAAVERTARWDKTMKSEQGQNADQQEASTLARLTTKGLAEVTSWQGTMMVPMQSLNPQSHRSEITS
jgi:hypothetical protein